MFSSFATLGNLALSGLLLAQGETAEAPPLTPTQQFFSSPLPLLAGLMALFFIVVMLPERRRKADEANRLSAVKKNDRIVTIGGIHGVVAAIADNDTVTIRLDESGNTRMKIDRKAIARILTESTEPSDAKTE